ncbi:MAG: diacylglycerol/lipid kinase family protein [Candidatus Nanopelagicaceae bacterium]
MVLLLLVNPTAGGGRGAKVGEMVRQWLRSTKRNFNEISASSAESAQSLLRASISDHIEAVIVVGGDGVMNLAMQVLAKTEVPLLPISAGTGNDFVRTLGIPHGVQALNLLNEPPKHIDLGRVNNRYFGNILSTGFDSLVNERANRMRMRHPIKYNLAMILELPFFQPKNYSFVVDGKRFDGEAMLIAIGNGRSYGGGMLVTPDANIQDNLLDLMVLSPVSKPEFLRVFPKVYKGTHKFHPKVSIIRGANIEVDAVAVAYADGERVGDLPITAHSVPGALLTWTA